MNNFPSLKDMICLLLCAYHTVCGRVCTRFVLCKYACVIVWVWPVVRVSVSCWIFCVFVLCVLCLCCVHAYRRRRVLTFVVNFRREIEMHVISVRVVPAGWELEVREGFMDSEAGLDCDVWRRSMRMFSLSNYVMIFFLRFYCRGFHELITRHRASHE